MHIMYIYVVIIRGVSILSIESHIKRVSFRFVDEREGGPTPPPPPRDWLSMVTNCWTQYNNIHTATTTTKGVWVNEIIIKIDSFLSYLLSFFSSFSKKIVIQKWIKKSIKSFSSHTAIITIILSHKTKIGSSSNNNNNDDTQR